MIIANSALRASLTIYQLISNARSWNNCYCYSFKIFPHFWLVKTTRIIHHNQLLFTKFEPILRHIESMKSKVQPAADYWTDDVKMTSKVQPAADYWTDDAQWRRKCSPLQIIEPLTEKTWGRDCVIFSEQKNKERNGETSLKTGEYFEWIIKQLLNSAFVGYEEFYRSRWITLPLIGRILHILRKPNSIIVKLLTFPSGPYQTAQTRDTSCSLVSVNCSFCSKEKRCLL